MGRLDGVESLLQRFGEVDEKGREELQREILVLARSFDDPTPLMDRLEEGKRGLPRLDARRDLGEVIEAIAAQAGVVRLVEIRAPPVHVHLEGPGVSLSWWFPKGERELLEDLRRGAVPVAHWPSVAPLFPPTGTVGPRSEQPVHAVITMLPGGYAARVGARTFTHIWSGFSAVALVHEGVRKGAWVTKASPHGGWNAAAFAKHAYPMFWAGEAVPSSSAAGSLWPDPAAPCPESLTLTGDQLVWRDATGAEHVAPRVFRDRIALLGDTGDAGLFTKALAEAGEPGRVSTSNKSVSFSGVSLPRLREFRVRAGWGVALSGRLVDGTWQDLFDHLRQQKVKKVTLYLKPESAADLGAVVAPMGKLSVKLNLETTPEGCLDVLRTRAWDALSVSDTTGLDVPAWLDAKLATPELHLGDTLVDGQTLSTTPTVLAGLLARGPVDRPHVVLCVSAMEGLGVLDGALDRLSVGTLEVGGIPPLRDADVPALMALLPCVREALIVKHQHISAEGLAALLAVEHPRVDAGPAWVDPEGQAPDPRPEGIGFPCDKTQATLECVREGGRLIGALLTRRGIFTDAARRSVEKLTSATSYAPIAGDHTRPAWDLYGTADGSVRDEERVLAFARALDAMSATYQRNFWDDIPDVPRGDRGMSHWHRISDEALMGDPLRAGRELSAAVLHLADPSERAAVRARLVSAVG